MEDEFCDLSGRLAEESLHHVWITGSSSKEPLHNAEVSSIRQGIIPVTFPISVGSQRVAVPFLEGVLDSPFHPTLPHRE